MTPILIQELLLICIADKKKPDKNQAKNENTQKLYIRRDSNNISLICCKLFFGKY